MPARGQVIRLAHNSIRAPGDRVCDTGRYLKAAAGADVKLRGGCGSQRLDIPEAVSLRLCREATEESATQVEVVVVLARGAPFGTIRTRHGFSLTGLESGAARPLIDPAGALEPGLVVHLLEAGLLEVEHRLRASQDARRVCTTRPGLEQSLTFSGEYLSAQFAILASRRQR